MLCAKLVQDGTTIYGKLSTYRDCLVTGEGMGQLCPISDNKAIDKKLLIPVKGVFEGTESKIGFIRITEPKGWKGREAKFHLTSSFVTLNKKVKTHTVEFYCAFTYEQIMAYRDLAADISSKEKLEDIYDRAVSSRALFVKDTP